MIVPKRRSGKSLGYLTYYKPIYPSLYLTEGHIFSLRSWRSSWFKFQSPTGIRNLMYSLTGNEVLGIKKPRNLMTQIPRFSSYLYVLAVRRFRPVSPGLPPHRLRRSGQPAPDPFPPLLLRLQRNPRELSVRSA